VDSAAVAATGMGEESYEILQQLGVSAAVVVEAPCPPLCQQLGELERPRRLSNPAVSWQGLDGVLGAMRKQPDVARCGERNGRRAQLTETPRAQLMETLSLN
jgi:hypothetical protein